MSDLTWITVLDLSLVAYLTYQVLANLRGTRAAQIGIGLTLVVVLFRAAEYLGLATLSFLLGTALPYLAFALIVIFQAEIRSTLAKFGNSPILSTVFGGSKTTSAVPNSVSEAVRVLASGGGGALIVIERDIGLADYAETGVGIDGSLSFELMVSLFSKAAPLHDGAVIIRGGRLAAAACYLPLTKRQDLGRELGTRHRAAIGLTEETDAVAVVVSDEGRIAVAVHGMIHRVGDASELQTFLQQLLSRAGRRSEISPH